MHKAHCLVFLIDFFFSQRICEFRHQIVAHLSDEVNKVNIMLQLNCKENIASHVAEIIPPKKFWKALLGTK